ncbi:MAG: DUF3833 domain-containing protein [Alphaproteobacteria bacterium]|nr:DUF3833 domain-containing protein [Alphaproteobacteria bacterium]
MKGRLSAALVSLIVLNSCTSMKPIDFKDSTPALVIEEYFAGETRAWGLFEDRFGRLRRQFTVDITGTWDGNELVLDERFLYSDGETDRRVWKIRKAGPHTYEGRADDVVGVANGEAYGNVLNWSYAMDLKVGDGTMRVRFNDWMFLQPSGVLLNRARVSKLGFEIGEVTLAFVKPGAGEAIAPESLTEWPAAYAPMKAASR